MKLFRNTSGLLLLAMLALHLADGQQHFGEEEGKVRVRRNNPVLLLGAFGLAAIAGTAGFFLGSAFRGKRSADLGQLFEEQLLEQAALLDGSSGCGGRLLCELQQQDLGSLESKLASNLASLFE